MRALRWIVIVLGLLFSGLPLVWMGLSSIKQRADAISQHPRWIPAAEAPVAPDSPRFEATTSAFRDLASVHAGAQASFWEHLLNSAIIGFFSTLATVALGTLCAYGFSRFRVPGEKDWLFFVLSTRFMPPLAVVVPVLLMYRAFDLQGTRLGLVVLYTVFNLSLAVWLMKGFLDEIPRAFEEAAVVDGYTRFGALVRVVLPEARTGIAVTAVFCLISAWNEYGFAMTLNSSGAVTVPAYFAGLQGNIEGMPWPQVAAGALVFVAPIVAFTVLVRSHLLRGVTFGTVKQ
ncbi:MAG: carbohydrate ABC transporter permease [Planctomycetes bacterium]|nr:carbohydrate ABC transporter permease [Planctomycetota bacterium]